MASSSPGPHDAQEMLVSCLAAVCAAGFDNCGGPSDIESPEHRFRSFCEKTVNSDSIAQALQNSAVIAMLSTALNCSRRPSVLLAGISMSASRRPELRGPMFRAVWQSCLRFCASKEEDGLLRATAAKLVSVLALDDASASAGEDDTGRLLACLPETDDHSPGARSSADPVDMEVEHHILEALSLLARHPKISTAIASEPGIILVCAF